jgi:hypothetical protein
MNKRLTRQNCGKTAPKAFKTAIFAAVASEEKALEIA